jgi:hypothetical protein
LFWKASEIVSNAQNAAIWNRSCFCSVAFILWWPCSVESEHWLLDWKTFAGKQVYGDNAVVHRDTLIT